MYTIIDKNTGQEITMHDMFRVSEPFPGLKLADNEIVVFIPDDSPLFTEIQTAYECIITVDKTGTATAVTVTKTFEQYWQENPPSPPKPTEIDYLLDLDYRLSMIELGLLRKDE
ncbi:hypothetical protein [Desulfotomaculum sp. 1211_IL3151]|uniref:hypothetical protein n=1 Tax=Desulfotomaculum sp. 1211_IL3151 TaxID=3084055 RepID=UPI002FDB0896